MTLNGRNKPLLNGLVLAGGKSIRMGQHKDQMQWHGREQRYHVADLLKAFCGEVFISCRQDQVAGLDKAYKALPDTFLHMGPLGGILSALRMDREAAWLVVACDLPLLNEVTLGFLTENRHPEKIATAFTSPHDGLPEPLITIWEPASYPVLLASLGQGRTCPRKALINSDIFQLVPPQANALMNVNTPQEAERALGLLKG